MTVTVNEGIRIESVPSCALCHELGRPLYDGMRDRLFDAPGVWGLLRCSSCGLVWLSPRPIPEDIGKVYATYFTHETDAAPQPKTWFRTHLEQAILATTFGYREFLNGSGWRRLGRAAGAIPFLRERVGQDVMYLEGFRRGKLLDVGCGSGGFLARMRSLGWGVQGVEPDAEAARIAREQHGIPVAGSTLEQAELPSASVDAVTMSHVIEHVHDPVALLRECHRVLRVGGRLAIVTPNVESLGRAVFRQWWMALDPPRHLCLFSLCTLRACAEKAGFRVELLRSNAWCAREIYWESYEIWRKGRSQIGRGNTWSTFAGWIFQMAEEGIRHFSSGAGEQLLLVAAKAGAPSEVDA